MKKKSVFTVVTAGVLAAAVLVTTIGGNSVVLQAAGKLPGVEKIVEDKVINNEPFRILEIVPTDANGKKGTGDIGFLVDGEHEEYINSIATPEALKAAAKDKANPAAEREKFVNEKVVADLKSKGVLEQADTNSNTLPLYAPNTGVYEEAYELTDTSGWNVLLLDDMESVIAKGNYVYVGPGQGQYEAQITEFQLTTDASGNYDVTFEELTDITDPDNLGKYGYYVMDANGDILLETKNVADLVEDTIYYVVVDYGYNPNGGEPYQGVLDTEEPYVYTGAGDFSFVKDEENGTEQKIVYTKVYYKINVTSNDWFKTKVIDAVTVDVDNGETPLDMETTVDTYSVSDLIAMNMTAVQSDAFFAEYDMFYLAGDFSNASGMTYAMTVQETIDKAEVSLSGLFTALADENTPFIIDRDIYSEIPAIVSENDELYTQIDNNPIYKCVLMAMNKPNPQELFENYVSVGTLNWLDLQSNIKTNITDKSVATFVTHNIYVVDEVLSNVNLETPFDETKITSGFMEIREMIETFNFTRDDDEKLSTTISKAVAIQYIINYQITGSVTNKTNIKVLEIQPCYDFDYMVTAREQQDKETTKIQEKTRNINELLAKSLGSGTLTYIEDDEFGSCVYEMTQNDITKSVTVYGMTTAEFIGKIEDLNTEYDLIYIGMNTGLMNTDSDGDTVYNDSAMDGLVYTHTGDAIICRNNISGLLYSDYVDSNSPYTSMVYDLSTGYSNNRWIHYNKYGYIGGEFVAPEIEKHEIPVYYEEGYSVNGQFKVLTKDNQELKYTKANVGNVNVYRFSGNDISQEKMNHVLDFVKAKYPVVLDNDFVYTSDAGVDIGINGNKVDNTSWMYKLIVECLKADNVFLRDSVISGGEDVANFYSYVNMEKLGLTVDPIKEITGYMPKQLEYTFTIDSTIASDYNRTYNVILYVDMNRDGRFGSAEKVDGLTLTDSDEQPVVEVDGKYIVYADEEYHLVRALSDDSLGAIPWKLEVVQEENPYLRTSQEGTLYIEAANGTEKQEIKVLQIAQTSKEANSFGNYRYNRWDLEKDLNNRNSLFYKCVNDPVVSDNFTITVDTYPSDNYVELYNDAAKDGKNFLDGYNMVIIGFADVYQDISNDIVEGNKNLDADGTAMGPVDAILKFIADGKSVLFTHDTTSYINVPTVNNEYYHYSTETNMWGQSQNTEAILLEKTSVVENNETRTYGTRFNGVYGEVNSGDNFNGYLFNTLLRNIVGMDRYGITNHDDKDTLMQLLKQGDVQRVKPSTTEGDVTYTYVNKTDGTTELVTTNKDVAYAANTWDDKTKTAYTYAETQGYNNNLLNQEHYQLERTNRDLYKQFYSLSEDSNIIEYGVNNYDNGAFRKDAGYTTYARKVNEGQITSYPYELPDRLVISETHAQWYQLDMEADDDGDGNSDIVVWYTICDIEQTSSGKAVDNFYTASPNDVRNNYYIYSKGNVMYSGVGHYDVYSEDEVKLFVNTMVAAYQTAAKDPTVKILNSADPNSGEKRNEYLYFDDFLVENKDEEGVIDRDLEMYFVMEESNLVTEGTSTTAQIRIGSEWINKSSTVVGGIPMEIQMYPAELGEAAAISPTMQNVTEVSGTETVTTKDVFTFEITPGTVYKVVIPYYYSKLLDDGEEIITIKVNSKFRYYGSAVEKESSASLYTLRAGLFNLN